MKTRSKSRKAKNLRQKFNVDSEDSQEYASTIISPDDDRGESKRNRKRLRKKDEQVGILLKEFNENPNWSKSFMSDLSKKTGLTESQVYKWNWDYRKKIRKSQKAPCEDRLVCKETIAMTGLDLDLFRLQKIYKLSFNTMPFATPSRFLFTDKCK